MGVTVKPRVVEIANAPGTGNVTLLGVPPGSGNRRRGFLAAYGDGARFPYSMEGDEGWEEGWGTVVDDSTPYLTRDEVIENSAGTTAKINFTGAVIIFSMVPASRKVFLDDEGRLPPLVFQSLGWGAINAEAPAWPTADVNDITVPSGVYGISGTEVNLPAAGTGSGIMVVGYRGANNNTVQLFFRSNGTSWKRFRDGSGWQAWARTDETAGSNANGSWTRLASGTLICRHAVPMTFDSSSTMTGSWTFPAAFSASPIVTWTAQGNPTPGFQELGISNLFGLSGTGVTLRQLRIAGGTNFQAGDTMVGHAIAMGSPA